ncbi:hypothetical protein TWF225_007206 [Orbilia oligospora]|uniref:Uncharacterized protein n=1 Tax=Orbilia oligospora TaxID=2813651 RepID=A0A7C8P6F3_ORBOL|nr:hypothetical protein TWF751_009922 [Orbilia oligospora]KAF3180846.1 hypothetical protein TWF225_007206 [Orbilia oligospora]KAF3254175.1 hypothetical protein TWF128_006297 [Orbilia oligospora]KAF3271998.1 hypothetical protein TWF217_003819 [Orbilia oligospora]KAF3287196.1 hypothetical protein TWF132_008568 [Orbilia oligospora]
MSLRSIWTKLTSYAQPLKGIFKGTQPRAIPVGTTSSTLYPNVGKAGAADSLISHGTTTAKHQISPQIGISDEILKAAKGLHSVDRKHKDRFSSPILGIQKEDEDLIDANQGANKAETGGEILDQGSAAGPVDSSTSTTKQRRKKKKKDLKNSEPGAYQEAKVLIDNLLDSISDPRIGSLGHYSPEHMKPKNSKVTIDALLESIPTSTASLPKPSSEDNPMRRRKAEMPVADPKVDSSDSEPYVNITNTSPPWRNKYVSRAYHILRLENCGATMIKSDIERIFSNYHARRLGWNFTVIPARSNPRLQRRNRYYLYFDSDEAANHHLAHFLELLRSEKLHGRSLDTTLPPPAAAQTFLESKPAGLDLSSEALQGSPASVTKYWVPNLVLVDPLKMPLDGVIPNLLYQAEGAPGRTVLIALCANSHWQVLQVWLKYSLIEKHGFGRWLVPGGDRDGYGLERIPIVGPNTPEPSQGGRWVVRFRDGYTSEAERLVRDWDGKWVNVRGKWGRLRAEVLW